MHDDGFGGGEDAYGPGSDLMISLFSISILLLAIVGAGQQIGQFEETVSLISKTQAAEQTQPTRGVPPLELVSRTQFTQQQVEMARLAAEFQDLKRQHDTQSSDLAEKSRRLVEMNKALEGAESQLVRLKSQTPDHYIELQRFAVPSRALAAFFSNPEELSVPFQDKTRKRIAARAVPFPPGANEILIETSIPPQLLALAPVELNDNGAIRAIYFLSMGLAQAYREALSTAGIPLACIRVNPGSFETSPEVRRKIMIETANASDAFNELATLYRGHSMEKAGETEAMVRITLGGSSASVCNPAMLERTLKDL